MNVVKLVEFFTNSQQPLSPEDRERLNNIRTVDECTNFLQQQNEKLMNVSINIGVIGCSGTGKSSLINALIGLQPKDKAAAKVGATESTTKSEVYENPKHPKLRLWDLPGVGTVLFPREKYLATVCFDTYDGFIVVGADGFFESDAWLGSEINSKGKSCWYVRTNIQSALDNHKKGYPKTHRPAEQLLLMKENSETEIHKVHKRAVVFLVDSHFPWQFEFPQLLEALVTDIPETKRHALTMILGLYSRSMVIKRAQEYRKQIYLAAMVSGAIGLVPLPGLSVAADIVIIQRESARYQSGLTITDSGIQGLSEATQEKLKSLFLDRVKGLMHGFLPNTLAGVTGLLRFLPVIGAMAAEEMVRVLVPLVGWVVGSLISIATTAGYLLLILERYEKAALENMDAVIAAQLEEMKQQEAQRKEAELNEAATSNCSTQEYSSGEKSAGADKTEATVNPQPEKP